MKLNVKILVAIVYMAAVYIVSGCSSETKIKYSLPEYEEDISASFEIMTDELVGLEYIRDIYCYGPYIIVISVSLKDWTLIHVFDKDTGVRLFDVLNRGRGPGEYLYDRNCRFNGTDGTMRIYDQFKGGILDFQIDSLLKNGTKAIKEKALETETSGVEKIFDYNGRNLVIKNASFIGNDTLYTVRFSLYDDNGKILAQYNKYPHIENEKLRWQLYMSTHAALSPDCKKLAVSSYYNGILETYSLEDDSVRNIAVGYFFKPDFHYDGGIIYTDNTRNGFSDLFATNDMIYSSFDCETNLKLHEEMPAGQRPLLNTDICIFNWNGRPLKRIRTDYTIARLCIDEDAGVLYAVVKDRQMRSYLGRINL